MSAVLAATVLSLAIAGCTRAAQARQPDSTSAMHGDRTPKPSDLNPQQQLLASASLPLEAQKTVNTANVSLAVAGACGLASTATAYWSVANMTMQAATTWLRSAAPKGMQPLLVVPPVDPGGVDGGIAIFATDSSAPAGLVYTMFPQASGVIIRVDAASFPKGAACAAQAASVPTPLATDAADAAAKGRALLAKAVMPPGSVKSATRPAGVATAADPVTGSCSPIVAVTGYWTLPSTSAVDTNTWLIDHAPVGMYVSYQDSSLGADPSIESVQYKFPHSQESLTYTMTIIGAGTGVRVDACG